MEDRDSQAKEAAGPFKPYQSILHAEVEQAVMELQRPPMGLVMSGLIAGFGIGASLLAISTLSVLGDGVLSEPVMRLLMANAYTLGFFLVILGNTDLFTEYTTIALLPVITGKSPWKALLRLWGIIYVSNLVGVFLFSWLFVTIGPNLGIATRDGLSSIATDASQHPGWVIFWSALLAGWLMGFLSWLVSSARETISQIFFVWLIPVILGLGHLHHAVVGAAEMFAALLVRGEVEAGGAAWFLLVVTVGNIVGGAVFAVMIRYSVLIRGEKSEGRGA